MALYCAWCILWGVVLSLVASLLQRHARDLAAGENLCCLECEFQAASNPY